MKLNKLKIIQHKQSLERHSLLVTNTIQSIDDLRLFMSLHVYAVWDFMSLLKTIQHNVTPSGNIWFPNSNNRSKIARMINEIVLCEETDINQGGGSISHFDMYLQAMLEVGADVNPILDFIKQASVNQSIDNVAAPIAAKKFMTSTFDMIRRGPHCAAAAFAYGRETIVPEMFGKILSQLSISTIDAPKFHYYLDRHIEVDGNEHGPMSEHLVEYFCKDDPILLHEAEQAAVESIQARIEFFNGIDYAIAKQ